MSVLQSLKGDDAASNLLGSVEAIGSLLGRSSAIDAGAFHYIGESILGMVNYCSACCNQFTAHIKIETCMTVCSAQMMGFERIRLAIIFCSLPALAVERVQLEDTLAGSYRFPKDCEFPLHH